MKYRVSIADQIIELELWQRNPNLQVRLGDKLNDVSLRRRSGKRIYDLTVGDRALTLAVLGCHGRYVVQYQGRDYPVHIKRELSFQYEKALQKAASTTTATGHAVLAHMPGLIVKVEVSVGQTVRAGDGLLILDAMKMENEIKAPSDGVVERIAIEEGQQVEKGELLCFIGFPHAEERTAS